MFLLWAGSLGVISLFVLLAVMGAIIQRIDPEGTERRGQDAEVRRLEREGAGVRTDRFEMVWELDGSDLLLSIDTDLPDEGELVVSVGRIYYEKGNSEAYVRHYFQESGSVARWRSPGRISLDAEAWKADLRAHQDEMAKLGQDFAFEIDRIEPNVNVRAVLHANQDAPQFGGRGNPHLSGASVAAQGVGNIVEAEIDVPFPLGGPVPTGGSRFVSHDGLKEGSSYRISKKTPLMPELEPSDPIAAVAAMRQLPPGTSLRVTNRQTSSGTLWYEVETSTGATGWINSIALIRQEIEREGSAVAGEKAKPEKPAPKPTEETPLLGVPIPPGAVLIDRNPGDGGFVDPSEEYRVNLSRDEIFAFYKRRMPSYGWKLAPPFAEKKGVLFFEKGRLLIGVIADRGTKRFSLMGS